MLPQNEISHFEKGTHFLFSNAGYGGSENERIHCSWSGAVAIVVECDNCGSDDIHLALVVIAMTVEEAASKYNMVGWRRW